MSKSQGAGQALNYYSSENYYQKNSEKGYLYGKGLDSLGIKQGTELDNKTYYHLLHGFNPANGTKLVKNAGAENRRAGFDVTTSAPKSLSLAVEKLQANNKDDEANLLIKAHLDANRKAMQKLQDNFIRTRIKSRDGSMIKIQTDGLMYATFMHDSSRELDPQLHSHNFIFNLVSYTDQYKKTKTLSLSNEEIYRHKMYLGQYYRNELNANLRRLGYNTQITNSKEGFFELSGFAKSQLDEFSIMTNIINGSFAEKLEDLKSKLPNAKVAKLKEIIKLESRPKKNKVDRSKVRQENNQRLDSAGINLNFIKNLKSSTIKKKLSELEIIEIIDKTVSVLTENQATFSKEELSRELMKFTLKDGLVEEDFLHLFSKSTNLIKLDKNIYSSHSLVEDEKYVIENMLENSNKLDKNTDKILNYCKSSGIELTKGQQKAVELILNTDKRFIAIQGDAGSGKTFSLKVINEVYKNEFDLIGLAPTGKAAMGLESQSGISSSTVDSYLLKAQNNITERTDKQRIIFIDESGMLGSQKFAQLMRLAQKNNDKVIFIGDTKQLQSVPAGQMFLQAQKFGMTTEYVTENMRQKDEDLKGAVEDLKIKKLLETFELLDKKDSVKELDKQDSINQIVDNYDNDTLILASTNADRKLINEKVRAKLGFQGDEFELMESVNLSGMHRYTSQAYDIGNIILLPRIEGFRKGEKVIVSKVVDDNKLEVITRDGKLKILDVSKHADSIQTFTPVRKKLAVGEKIVFTKITQDKKSGLRVSNGSTAIIKNIQGKNITIELGKGKEKEFNIDNIPYIDYAYALTDYKSQGMTVSKIAIMSDMNMSSFNSFYTQLTRAKYKATVYTTNKDEFRAKIEKLQRKQTTLEYSMPNAFAKANKTTKDKYEHGDYLQVGADRKEPDGFTGQTNRNRKIYQWNLSNIGKNIRRAARAIANYLNIGRNYTHAREFAKTINGYNQVSRENYKIKNTLISLSIKPKKINSELETLDDTSKKIEEILDQNTQNEKNFTKNHFVMKHR